MKSSRTKTVDFKVQRLKPKLSENSETKSYINPKFNNIYSFCIDLEKGFHQIQKEQRNHQTLGSTRGSEFELWERNSVEYLVVELCRPYRLAWLDSDQSGPR